MEKDTEVRKLGNKVVEKKPYGWDIELKGHSYRSYWPSPRGFWERVAARLRRGWELPIRPKATTDKVHHDKARP